MNDFLQSLRTAKTEKQRTPMTRRTYQNSYPYTNQQFNSNSAYQRSGAQHPGRQAIPGQMPTEENLPSLFQDAVEKITRHIEILANNQEYLINAQEKAADMMERQTIAMEKIAKHLNIFPKQFASPETSENLYQTAGKSDAIAADPVEDLTPDGSDILEIKKNIEPETKGSIRLLGRKEIMDMIYEMREKGDTFDQVAQRLIALGQPTFSGRGEWHAQTIHRLLNK